MGRSTMTAHGACGHGGADVVVAVGVLPAAGHEDIARADASRVVADGADDRVEPAVRRDALVGQQAAAAGARS